MPMIEHKVVYSPSRGVFLGVLGSKVVWSKDKGARAEDKAPVFDDKPDLEKYVKEFLTDEERNLWPDDVQLITVYPSDTNPVNVDREVCAASNLPIWGECPTLIK